MNKGDYSRAVVLRTLIALSSSELFGGFAIGLIFNHVVIQGGPLVLPLLCVAILLLFFLSFLVYAKMRGQPFDFRRRNAEIMSAIPAYRHSFVLRWVSQWAAGALPIN